jgi:hypothetical protein
VQKTLAEDVPAVLDYLEAQAPADGFFFGALSIADVAVAVFFRNAGWARFKIDAARWPRIAGLVDRTLRSDGFQAVRPFEDTSMRTPPTEQRAALLALGAPLTNGFVRHDDPAPRGHVGLAAAHPVDDVEAIKQLKARYFRTMDTKDWAAMRGVFTDDVVMDTTEAGGE